jgi:hypothetical protein
MSIDLTELFSNQVVWVVLAVVGIIVAYVIIRFFWKHLLKYLFQGCLVVLGIILLLALLRYFKVF